MQVFEQKSGYFLPFYGNISMSKIFLPRFKALRHWAVVYFYIIFCFALLHFLHFCTIAFFDLGLPPRTKKR